VASLQPVTDEMRAEADEMGLIFWFDGSCTVYSSGLGFDSFGISEKLKDAIEREDLIFALDDEVQDGIGYILNDLKTGKYHMMRIRETQQPVLR
jgi:hypothetical protein